GGATGVAGGGGVLVTVQERAFPTHDVEVVDENVFLRVVAGDQDAERIVGKRIAEQSAEGGRDATVLRVVGCRDERARLRADVIERIRRLDVDRRADCSRGEAEVRRLVNIELADILRAQGGKVEVLAVARGN